ncbi:penicillin-binding protein activator [Microvirga puerhi]|uniref:Penicillin-binding protein activator n=1 Tax=Microvirga puerhi TaxID=2876078 RepID=A0ABS7VMF9_9HYPH|nr:penicillin-binding protein activator [Microvirga puerhi]MBZ6076729.1 penicillin-binding protein activator [Microvirga puerhi]
MADLPSVTAATSNCKGFLLRRTGPLLGLAGALALAGCVGSGSMQPPRRSKPPVATADPVFDADLPVTGAVTGPAAEPPSGDNGATIGNGPVRVALLLPLSGQGQGAVAAQSLRNAAELALSEIQGPQVTLLVKDDRGTPEGARDAASQALAEGAELIIGPLFAGSVQGAAQVARQAGRPIVAFSTDTSVAARGVYLLSFLVQAEVDRVISYAASQGRRSVAALIPQSTYGSVAEAQFREAAARQGMRVVVVEHYSPGQPQAAVQRIAPLVAGAAPQADTLFIPDNGDGLPAVAQALQVAGFNPQRVKPIGTGLWNEPRIFALPVLQGGWFSAPDNRGFEAFAARYRARFNTDPIRLATLSYDAVTLAATLTRVQGSQRFAEGVLTNPAGFAGADGVFRFKPDGSNDRALAIQEIRGGMAAMISAAPRSLVAANGI